MLVCIFKFSKVLGGGKLERWKEKFSLYRMTRRSAMLMLMKLEHESVIQVTNYRMILGYLGTYHRQDGILPILEIIYYLLSSHNYVYLFDNSTYSTRRK